MKIDLPQIHWHGNKERIMSLDFHPTTPNFLITCGADMYDRVWIRYWQIQTEPEFLPIHLEDLAGTHERTVNVVRFSPNGTYLASGSDDGCVVIWERRVRPVFGQDREQEGWCPKRVLRGHVGEIHDICWDGTSKFLASCGMDGFAFVFDIDKAKIVSRLEVSCKLQGIAWYGKTIALIGTDRTLRILKRAKKGFYVIKAVKDYEKVKLFNHEVSGNAFFRRLSFSIDGSLLLVPSGEYNDISCVHAFMKKQWDCPMFSLPINVQNSNSATSIAVSVCPQVFESEQSTLVTGLGHKLVWAVCTRDSVLVYTSESVRPVYAVCNLHYAPLTDIRWMNDRMLAISSTDGYISFLSFEAGEFGIPVQRTDKAFVSVSEETTPSPQKVYTESVVVNGKRRLVLQQQINSNYKSKIKQGLYCVRKFKFLLRFLFNREISSQQGGNISSVLIYSVNYFV